MGMCHGNRGERLHQGGEDWRCWRAIGWAGWEKALYGSVVMAVYSRGGMWVEMAQVGWGLITGRVNGWGRLGGWGGGDAQSACKNCGIRLVDNPTQTALVKGESCVCSVGMSPRVVCDCVTGRYLRRSWLVWCMQRSRRGLRWLPRHQITTPAAELHPYSTLHLQQASWCHLAMSALAHIMWYLSSTLEQALAGLCHPSDPGAGDYVPRHQP